MNSNFIFILFNLKIIKMLSNKSLVTFICLTIISQSYAYYSTGECVKSPVIMDFSAEKVCHIL